MGQKRCRFVQPAVVRLYLVDVAKRRLHTLQTVGKPTTVNGKEHIEPASPDDLADAESAVAQATEDGDWLDVKAELNAGETRRIFTDLVKDLRAGERAVLDAQQVGHTKITQYLVGWSFVDAQGRSVPVSVSALENLDTDTYRDVSEAIDAHDEAAEARRAERKNARGTESTSSATSPSVNG